MCLCNCASKKCCYFFDHPMMINWCLWEKVYTSLDEVVAAAVTNMVTVDGFQLMGKVGKRQERGDRSVREDRSWFLPLALMESFLVLLYLTILWPLLFLFSSIFSLPPMAETICPITFDTSCHKNTLFNDNHLQRHYIFSMALWSLLAFFLFFLTEVWR